MRRCVGGGIVSAVPLRRAAPPLFSSLRISDPLPLAHLPVSLLQLINAAKQIGTPSLTVHLLPEFAASAEKAKEVSTWLGENGGREGDRATSVTTGRAPAAVEADAARPRRAALNPLGLYCCLCQCRCWCHCRFWCHCHPVSSAALSPPTPPPLFLPRLHGVERPHRTGGAVV